MKVILLQDVAKIGKRFSVVDVPDGYAANQLIPKKMAEPASPVNLKKIERRQAGVDASKQADAIKFEKAKDQMLANVVKVLVDANEQGHLFKAVHEIDVIASAKVAGIDIDPSMLKINHPIKEVGTHTITLTQGGVTAEVTIEVVKK